MIENEGLLTIFFVKKQLPIKEKGELRVNAFYL